MECTFPVEQEPVTASSPKQKSRTPSRSEIPARHDLSVLVVSRDRDCLTSCCYKLGNLSTGEESPEISVHGAPSTELGARMFEWKHYDVLIVDPRGVDWHRLQLHVAQCALRHRRAMPVVAVLRRDAAPLANQNQWGEGNDYDETLSYPLRRDELESFLASCSSYCPYL